MEKRRQPKKIEPPDRIGEKFRNRERPGLSVTKKFEPRDLCFNLFPCTTADVLQLRASQPRMFGRIAIFLEPPKDPGNAKKSRHDEGGAPAVANGDPRHGGGSENRANICARIQHSCCQRAFTLRKPIR